MSRDRTSRPSHHDSRALSSSFRSASPLAEQYLASDIAACSDDEEGDFAVAEDTDGGPGHLHPHMMDRRLSGGVAFGGSRPVAGTIPTGGQHGLSPLEQKRSRDAERSLLRDNHILPPKHHRLRKQATPSWPSRLYRRLFSTKVPREQQRPQDGRDVESAVVPSATETSPLLGSERNSVEGSVDDTDVDEQWEHAVVEGRISSTWQRESKTIAEYSGPLIITFFLQYSINAASVIAAGRLGTAELGAVSLANMSAAITCLAPFQGLATSLDTLCAQAYGSGHRQLVGLQLQRMVYFLSTLTVPVAILWFFSEPILARLIPDAETARLAALYLRVMIFSIPGLVLFECGKRFTQAQGLFRATTYVLVIAAPLNAFLLWLLVWHLGLGFVGAPIAVAITESTLPILLFLYVRFIDGSQCWGGFTRRALSNWGVMVRLALPGMVMIEAEWLAFEIMTLLASRFGSDVLAAQSAVMTLATISYQIPFPVSIAASTRVANLIGAGLVEPAKVAARVAFVACLLIGILNLVIYSALRYKLPLLFTTDESVIAIAAQVLPLIAFMQVFDGLSAGANGLLRGIGKQAIGGPTNLIAYYVISLPISLGLAFGLNWQLHGLWTGVTIGLAIASTFEYVYLMKVDWYKAAREAELRNEEG